VSHCGKAKLGFKGVAHSQIVSSFDHPHDFCTIFTHSYVENDWRALLKCSRCSFPYNVSEWGQALKIRGYFFFFSSFIYTKWLLEESALHM